jgi:hypothetical protein
MSPTLSRLGLVIALSLTATGKLMAQQALEVVQPVKPTGPAAKKTDDLIRAYTARIEKEIEEGHKEVARLRAELHELIDVRYAMADAIAEMRGELATKGKYSGDPVVATQAAPKEAAAPAPAARFRRDFVYGLGSALPKDPTEQQREQLRRLAPRTDLKRMISDLRAKVDETRVEVDQLAYTLLELSSGVTQPSLWMGGMGGGIGGGMGVPFGQWFGSMGTMQGMQGGMR